MHKFSTILLTATLSLPVTALAAEWQVIHDDSVLGFATTQQGSRFEGRFDFTADMRFDRDNPQAGAFDVTIDVTSVETGSRDRDNALADKEFFWFDEYPEAYFRTTAIQHVDGDDYVATAELTIRGHTQEVTLPFTWTEDGDTAAVSGSVVARMDGGLTLEPLDYDVGSEEWVEDGSIGRETEVFVDLLLERRDS